MTEYTGPPLYGGDPHGSPPYSSGSHGADRRDKRVTDRRVAPVGQGSTASLREQASRLIEARAADASLLAAGLYLQEADRIFADAACQFSEARQLTEQVAADRRHLARGLRQMEQESQAHEVRSRELDRALDHLAAREAALEARQDELAAREATVRAAQIEVAQIEAAQKKSRRRPADVFPAPAFPDSGPLDLRPDPRTARTAREFRQMLYMFRIYTGNRSLRQISEQSGGRISASSVRNVMSGPGLPDRFEPVDAIVIGCGGSDDDRAEFAAAWRRLRLASPVRPPSAFE